jgi:hypothetical protein
MLRYRVSVPVVYVQYFPVVLHTFYILNSTKNETYNAYLTRKVIRSSQQAKHSFNRIVAKGAPGIEKGQEQMQKTKITRKKKKSAREIRTPLPHYDQIMIFLQRHSYTDHLIT